jgi:flavin reductase ActVB
MAILTPALFRRAVGFIPSSVAVLSTPETRLTVSSLQCVSFDPPWISVSIQRDSQRGAAILQARDFRAQLLRDHEQQIARDREPLPHSALLKLDCTLRAIHEIGDHLLALAEVTSIHTGQGTPLIYWRRGFQAIATRHAFLESPAALDNFIQTWEAGRLAPRDWTHAAHVATCAYFAALDPRAAFERMKRGILQHNACAGASTGPGYHETLTRLWAAILIELIKHQPDPFAAATHAVDLLGEDRDLHYLYYSFDVTRDPAARQRWIAPDLQGPWPLAAELGSGVAV